MRLQYDEVEWQSYGQRTAIHLDRAIRMQGVTFDEIRYLRTPPKQIYFGAEPVLVGCCRWRSFIGLKVAAVAGRRPSAAPFSKL